MKNHHVAKFSTDYLVSAWVFALSIIPTGTISVTQLPISQYPIIVPPLIIITVTYLGVNTKTLDESIVNIIEQEMNDADSLFYMELVSQGDNG